MHHHVGSLLTEVGVSIGGLEHRTQRLNRLGVGVGLVRVRARTPHPTPWRVKVRVRVGVGVWLGLRRRLRIQGATIQRLGGRA